MHDLGKLSRRYEGLRIFSDETHMRICAPIASSQVIFENCSPAERGPGEITEVIETVFGGKFQLPVEATPSLEPASGRTNDVSLRKPLATIEIWSLEPGSYDLILRLPKPLCESQSETVVSSIINRFVDQAHEVSRTIDNLDLLRFHSGPSLSLKEAHQRLNRLELHSGTRLDTENLLHILKNSPTLKD